MDIKPPTFVRWVEPDEHLDDLINEAKARTWVSEAEHAILSLETGERPMVMGGLDGIQFEVEAADHGDPIILKIEGRRIRVSTIDWHTHPRVTGPTDGDRKAMILLNQRISRIYELGDDSDGTSFGPDKHQPNG